MAVIRIFLNCSKNEFIALIRTLEDLANLADAV